MTIIDTPEKTPEQPPNESAETIYSSWRHYVDRL